MGSGRSSHEECKPPPRARPQRMPFRNKQRNAGLQPATQTPEQNATTAGEPVISPAIQTAQPKERRARTARNSDTSPPNAGQRDKADRNHSHRPTSLAQLIKATGTVGTKQGAWTLTRPPMPPHLQTKKITLSLSITCTTALPAALQTARMHRSC